MEKRVMQDSIFSNKRVQLFLLITVITIFLGSYIESSLTGYPVFKGGRSDVFKNCGNNRIDRGEVCDGINLKGKTCLDFGYTAGALACSSNCLSYDTSGCTQTGTPECSDGFDNDFDTLTDYPEDYGCTDALDNDESDDLSLTLNLVGYYNFDNNVNDISGNGNNGIIFGNPQYIQGIKNNAIQFDGVDDYVQLTTNYLLPIYNQNKYSISFWSKSNVLQSDKRTYSEGSNTNGNTLFTLGTGQGTGSVNMKLRSFVRPDAGSAVLDQNSISDAFDGINWNHVVFTNDNGIVDVYVNGILDSSYNYNKAGSILTPNRAAIGAQLKSSASQYFNGYIDEFRIYNKILNSNEISLLAGIPPPPPTGYCGDNSVQCPNQYGFCEVCDPPGSTQSCTAGGYPGSQSCLSDCSGYDTCSTALYCGDGTCTNPPENPTTCPSDCQNPECSDTFDNDGDGVADYPNDFSCSSSSDTDETNPKAQCHDGLDNDSDGNCDFDGALGQPGCSGIPDVDCSSLQDNDESFVASTCNPGVDCFMVMPGATGSNNGLDWNNAFTQLPTTLVRGATYYLADGNYLGSVFDDPVQGTQYITIKKATISDHGTNIGWLNSYGDGQAIWPDRDMTQTKNNIVFATSYYIFDGVTGSGIGTNDPYGFRFEIQPDPNTIPTPGIISINNADSISSVNYITISHVEVDGFGEPLGYPCYVSESPPFHIRSDTPADSITVSNVYFHDIIESLAETIGPITNFVLENSWLARDRSTGSECTGGSPQHASGIEIRSSGGSNNILIRNNIWEDIEGTGAITLYDWAYSNVYVYGNVFIHTKNHPGGLGQGVFDTNQPATVQNAVFYNNLIIGNYSQAGMVLAGSSIKVYNNIWYDDVLSNNNIIVPADHDYNTLINAQFTGAVTPGPNEEFLTGPSPFVDVWNYDFHLAQPTTVGLTLPAPYNIDPDGKIRGADGNWDRGAYEY